MRRALVIAVTRLGDLIQTEPMLRALRRSGSADHVTLLVEKSFLPVARLLNGADEIFDIDFEPLLGGLDSRVSGLPLRDHAKLAAWLADSAFDVVFNLTHTRPSMVMSRLTGNTVQGVTLDNDGSQVVRNPWLQYFFATNLARPWSSFNLIDVYVNAVEPAVDFNSRLPQVGKPAFGRSVNRWQDAEIVIHAGASQSDKQWPLNRFVELSDLLLDRGARVTLIGGKRSSEISSAFPVHKSFTDRMGQTSVEDLQSLFANASLLVSADSGPVHVAAASGLPIIAIEGGSAHGFETAPYMEGSYVIQPHLDQVLERIPNKTVTSASAERVTVETVMSLIESHFDQHMQFIDSPGCSIYRTAGSADIPGLELVSVSGEHKRYDQWQSVLRRVWWSVIGLRGRTAENNTSVLSRSFDDARKSAHDIYAASADVKRLASRASALSSAEHALAKELLKHPPLHHVNHFLQIARASVGGESISEMAAELESLYGRFHEAVRELQPLLKATSTFDFIKSHHKEAVL